MTNLEKELLTNESMVLVRTSKLLNETISLLELVKSVRKLSPKEKKILNKAFETKEIIWETYSLD